MLRLLVSASGAPDRTPSASEGLFASRWYLLGRSLALPVLLGALSLCPCLVLAEDPPLPNPDKPVDYIAWINAQCSKGIKENAADVYLEAFDAFVEDKQAAELATRWDPPWRDYERSKLQHWMKRNEKCLERFTAATGMRDCYFELKSETGAMLDARLPMLSPFRDMSRMLAARARLRLDAGETEAAVEDIATIICVGRHLESQPHLISYLVGMAVRALGYEVLMRLPTMVGEPIDFEMVVKTVRRVDRTPATLKTALEYERIVFLDTLQRSCVDTDGDGRLDRIRIPGLEDAEYALTEPVASLVSQHYPFHERWREMAAGEYAAGLRLHEGLREELKARVHPAICVLMPDFWRAIQLHHRSVALRSAARIILHMHAFKAEHGRWPKDLKETGAPSSFRQDPFSGQDFVYRLKDGEPLLYSVGENGTDDGGKPATDGKRWSSTGDAILWPPVQE
jgi:hypothetical protein